MHYFNLLNRGLRKSRQIRYVMRIGAFVLPLIFLSTHLMLASATHGQGITEKKITIEIRKESLRSALNKVGKASGFRMAYVLEHVLPFTQVDLPLHTRSVEQTLRELLQGTGLDFKEGPKNSILIIRDSGKKELPDASTGLNISLEEKNGFATRSLNGVVLDENGMGLPGVSIILKGTQSGTISNVKGEFVLDIPDGNNVLIFSFVGYLPEEVEVNNSTNLQVVLKTDNRSLEEVVVVGYGTVKKSDLTGSVAKVGEAMIKSTPILSLDRAMQGRAAGVLVTQNSSRPGGDATIRIRGTGSVNAGNEPLYVVDGFPTESISAINPNDIESIEILKDASATAIYGSRGSNGVVMVTTKRGKAGHSVVDFESYYGVQSARRTIPLLNAAQYAAFINEARVNGGGEAYFDGSSPERPSPSQLGNGTDWQKEVLRQAPIQNYQLSFSGGESKTKYAISGSYFDQKGILLNSYFKRYTLRTNLDRDISSKLKVGLSMQGSFSKSNAARTESDGGGSSGVTNATLNFAPVFPVLNANGGYYRDQSSLNGNLVDNPVGIAKEITDQTLSSRVLANFYASYQILSNLQFRTSWGADITNGKNNYYVTRLIGLGQGTNGSAYINSAFGLNWLNENTLQYTTDFSEKHKITALLGYTTQASQSEYVLASAMNFNNDFAFFNNLGAAATLQKPASGANEWALISYLARVNYAFADRFLVTLTTRRDGSSRFGPNNKYGFFPSGAVAWRLGNEQFLRNQKVVSDLKLRASYGLTGNQSIGDYLYSSLIGNVNYPLGGPNAILLTGGVPNGISNLDLSWEKNMQTDIGLDVAFLGNRIQLTADYYIKTTTDLLFDVNVPQTTGYSTSLRNIGQIENKGFELALNTINIRKNGFEWATDFNVAFNRNKVLNLDGRPEFITGSGSGHLGVSNTVRLKIGEPLGNFYGRKVAGIFQSQSEVDASAQKGAAAPGDFKYEDLNGDGIINDLDRTVIGNGNPRFFGGINNTLKYKGFELNFFFQGSYGNEILNFGRFDLYNLNGNNNQSADVLDRWTETNKSSSIPRANAKGGQRILSDFHVEDGSYLRLKNLSFGYTLPENLLKNNVFKTIKLYVLLQNSLTFTKYKGYDPEVSRFGNSSINQGMDYGGYPAAKSTVIGLNVKF